MHLLFVCCCVCSHTFSHATYSTSSIVFIVVVVSRRVGESDKLLVCVRANRSLYILWKISIFLSELRKYCLHDVLGSNFPLELIALRASMFCSDFVDDYLTRSLCWWGGRLFEYWNSSFKTQPYHWYWNLAYILLFAMVGISVFVDPN